MGSNPTLNATIVGIVMQGVLVAVGKFVPAIGQTPNFYAIAGTMLVAVTGALVPRRVPGAGAGQAATGGLVAGGASSVVGGLFAVLTGRWPEFQVWQLLFPAISGGVGGGIGGLLGRVVGP